MEERLIELETKLAFQEDLIQDLNQVIIGQQKQLDDLDTRLKRLTDRMKDLSSQPATPATGHEIPPHY